MEMAWGEFNAELLVRVFQDKCHHCDCPEKIADPRLVKRSQDRSNGVQRLKNGTCTAKRLLLQAVSFFTQTRLRTASFAQGIVYAGKLLHREALTPRSLYTGEPLHTEAFTQRNVYTQKLLHREAFTRKSFLHKQTCTQRSLYTQELLHIEAFTQRSLLGREVFTQRSFYTEKSLH